MKSRFALIGALAGAGAAYLFAQRPAETPSWAPKRIAKTVWTAPHKPHTKIAEVRAEHAGQKEWRHLVVDDDHFTAAYVQMPAGGKVGRRFHPDTRQWWVILDGQIKYTIEGQEPFVATKGSMVQVPMQTIFEMETVGDKPSVRWEVDIAHAKTMYPQDVSPPKLDGFEFIPVVLNRKAQPYGYNNVPHINLYELAKRPENSPDNPKSKGNFQHRFIHDDRGVSNIIYGYEKNLAPYNPKNRGHFHPECSEFWLVMEGQIRYPIEYAGNIIASQGDVVYVPPFTFHAPRFHGEGPSCRLAMNGYPNIAHLFDSEVPH